MTSTGLFLSKRSRIFVGAAVAAMVVATGSAHAEEAPATAREIGPVDARPLTLDDALQLAKRNNRDLRQARARVAEAHALELQAWSPLLPTAATQGKYTHNYKEVTLDFSVPGVMLPGLPSGPVVLQKQEQLDFALNAAIPLLVPWAYPALKAAQANEASGAANEATTESAVLFSTAQAYYGCAGADELVEARRHGIAVAQKALDNAKARLEAGVVNRVEVTRAELQLLRQQQALLESEDTQASSYRALQTLLAVHEPVRVMPTPEPPPSAEDVPTRAENALTLRPEFTAYRKAIEGNRLTVQSNALRWLPTVSAFGTVRAFNYPGFAGDNYAWAVGLQLDWTLYDGGVRDAQRKLAAAQRAENEARIDLLRDQVSDDIYNADRALKTKRRALETAKRSVQLSKETLDLVQVQHDAGTATQLDLLTAQDNLVSAEVALAQARFDLSLGALSLERVSGTFPNNLNLK